MGSWAPGSSDWEEVDIDEKERVGARRSPSPGMEGEFWMTYMDFIRTFTHLEVVHFNSETEHARTEPLDHAVAHMSLETRCNGRWMLEQLM